MNDGELILAIKSFVREQGWTLVEYDFLDVDEEGCTKYAIWIQPTESAE